MNQKHLWTVVAVLGTIAGTPLIGRSEKAKETAPISSTQPAGDVVKVGEYQTPTAKTASDTVAIAKIHTHEVAGRPATTLYVRDIPVLTFVGNQPVASTEGKKVGEIGNVGTAYRALDANTPTKVATTGGAGTVVNNQTNFAVDDPVQRASLVAARINQLALDKVGADKINVVWQAKDASTTATQAENKNLAASQDPSAGRFIIKANDQELVEIDKSTKLAGTTTNPAQDALQATNRLRRLVGNASPLDKIAGLPEQVRQSIPKAPQQIAQRVLANFRGIASFYGYDFAGNRTATGERFNPEGLTAAHRSLPFGTRVRVTNTRNGRSVIVRINDRGPFIRGRVIDLSIGAARVLGMTSSGVAPVRIEVLGR